MLVLTVTSALALTLTLTLALALALGKTDAAVASVPARSACFGGSRRRVQPLRADGRRPYQGRYERRVGVRRLPPTASPVVHQISARRKRHSSWGGPTEEYRKFTAEYVPSTAQVRGIAVLWRALANRAGRLSEHVTDTAQLARSRLGSRRSTKRRSARNWQSRRSPPSVRGGPWWPLHAVLVRPAAARSPQHHTYSALVSLHVVWDEPHQRTRKGNYDDNRVTTTTDASNQALGSGERLSDPAQRFIVEVACNVASCST